MPHLEWTGNRSQLPAVYDMLLRMHRDDPGSQVETRPGMSLPTATTTVGGDDFFGSTAEDFLGPDPRMAFMAFQPQMDRSPNQRRWFSRQFQPALDEFKGARARSLKGGIMPQQTFSDFLVDYPFLNKFLSEAPGQRGASTGRFAPRVKMGFF